MRKYAVLFFALVAAILAGCTASNGNSEVDVSLSYADYYFLEALSKYIAL